MSQKKHEIGKNTPVLKKQRNYSFLLLLYEFQLTLSVQDAFVDQQKRLLIHALAIQMNSEAYT